MPFNWQEVLSEGLSEFLHRVTQSLEQEIFLMQQLDGPVLWPTKAQGGAIAWSEALHIDDQLVGYLAGTGELPQELGWIELALRERIQAIILHRQLNVAQVRLIEEIKVHTELEEALKFMELRALQSQVNPHFLFNTLTTIAGLAMFEDASRTTQLVHSLSRLLRYSLRKIGQTVPLREELTHVQDYLAIQKARFAERIKVTVDVSEAVNAAQVPVLTLQPLVENAIIHGLETKEEGSLSLVGYQEGERVVIHVIDNGVGLDEARLAEVREMRVNSSGRSHTTGLGLNNVHKRLQHFFGHSYGLDVTSQVCQGTQVTVTIPFVR